MAGATLRNDSAAPVQTSIVLDSIGKSAAFDCLGRVVDGCGVARKVLASQCEMSESYFAKVIGGHQGDVLALLDKPPMHAIRAEWYRRMAELEQADPVDVAAEQLVLAAVRFLTLRGGKARMVKASL